MPSGIPSKKLTAIKIAAAYALVAGLWILFSDRIIAELFSDIPTLAKVSTFKGWFFAGITSWMLYLLIQRDIGLIQRSKQALKDSVAGLEAEKTKTMAILAAIGDGICIIDTDLKILYQNRAHEYFLGSHTGKYCYRAYTDNASR